MTDDHLFPSHIFPKSSFPASNAGANTESKTIDRSVAARWTPRLAENHFTAVSAVFLENLQRLRPHDGARGLNPTEAMVIIQLMSFKWDARAPFPALTTIADRLGLAPRTVRATVKRLEELGYIRREASTFGGTNRYHFDGLFRALEALLDERGDAAADASQEEAA